jgi:hypothetical protein
MAKSANRTTYPVETPRSATQTLYARLQGNGATDLVLPAQEALNGEIISATFVSTGVYAVTFRYSFPELKQAPDCSFGPSVTAGLSAQFTAIDITAGTGTLNVFVGSTPTNLAVGDFINLNWAVRNSGKNK